MKRTLLLRWVNSLLLVVLVTQVASAMLRTKLPYAVFHEVHELGGLLLALLALLHLILNWGWVKAQFGKRS